MLRLDEDYERVNSGHSRTRKNKTLLWLGAFITIAVVLGVVFSLGPARQVLTYIATGIIIVMIAVILLMVYTR